jgi:hypothetical protein
MSALSPDRWMLQTAQMAGLGGELPFAAVRNRQGSVKKADVQDKKICLCSYVNAVKADKEPILLNAAQPTNGG